MIDLVKWKPSAANYEKHANHFHKSHFFYISHSYLLGILPPDFKHSSSVLYGVKFLVCL